MTGFMKTDEAKRYKKANYENVKALLANVDPDEPENELEEGSGFHRLMEGVLCVEKEKIFKVVLSTGGPHFEYDFHFDETKEGLSFKYVEAVYKDLGTREEEILEYEEEEAIIRAYGEILDPEARIEW